ncbi:ABC transporter, putative, partial [Bodo saltans]
VDNCAIVFDGTYEELQRSTVDVVRMIGEQSPETSRNAHDAVELSPAEQSPSASSPRSSHEKEAKKPRATEIPLPNHEELKSLMSTEHQNQGSISAAVFAWYFKIQGPFTVFWVFFLFSLWRGVSIIADLMVSWWSSRAEVIGHHPDQDQYLEWYGIFIAIALVILIVRQIPFVIAMLNASTVSNSKMVSALLHAPTSFFDTTPTGRVISRFSKDMEQMDVIIPESLNFFYNMVVTILGSYGLMIYSAWYLFAVIVVLIAVLAVVYTYYTTTNRAQKRLEATNRSPMTSVLNETLGGLPTIRAYDMVDNFTKKHALRLRLSVRSVYSWRASQRWFSIRIDAMSSSIVLATTLIICGVVVSSDDPAQAPVMSLAITYSIGIASAFGYLTTMTSDLESGMSSVERVKEYCDELPQEKVVEYGTEPEDIAAPPENWPSAGAVDFQNASLRYRDGLPLVLKSLTLRVEAGHKVGVVGRTGSGKSTIMLALFRMVELAEGTISFDGVNIANLKMKDLRNKITIIPQDPMLFQGTVRSNLDPFSQVSDDEVWRVLDTVGISERVKRDGEGLECVVAEKGANFSVGQRQLLCLARALLKNCKILLLDEATASVDFEADALIQRTLRTAFKDCTVLTIAHRLATVIDSDRIMLMEHGVLKEYDSPANLVRSDESLFNAMLKRLGPEQYGMLYNEALAAEKK